MKGHRVASISDALRTFRECCVKLTRCFTTSLHFIFNIILQPDLDPLWDAGSRGGHGEGVHMAPPPRWALCFGALLKGTAGTCSYYQNILLIEGKTVKDLQKSICL